MPYRAVATAALDEWRDLTRRMEDLEPGTAAWQELHLAAEVARARYQEAFDTAAREQMPSPPPFEDVRDEA
jgi:hypothetical protein